MVISNQTFELNRTIKENVKTATDEVDIMLYKSARKYINSTEEEAQRKSAEILKNTMDLIRKKQ